MTIINTLKGRLILVFGIFLIIVMSAVSPIIFNKMKELILTKHIISAQRLTHTGAIPLIDAMLSNSVGNLIPNEYIHNSLDILRATSNEQILFAYFISDDGKNIFSSTFDPSWHNHDYIPQFDYTIFSKSDHWILQTVERIEISTKLWGFLVIGFNADDILSEVKQTFIQVFIVAGMVILFTLFIVYIIAEILTKRLNLLTQAVDRFDFYPIEEELPVGDDEIGRLAIHFSDLWKRLIKSRQELKESDRNLFHTEKLAAIGRLAAGVAHEINNPLTGIRHSINNVLEDPDDKASREEYLELIDEALKKIESIISKLLGFSHRQDEKNANSSINDSINTVSKLIEYSVQSKNIRLELNLDKNIATIKCSPHLLDEIAMNIILNSIDAVKSGGKIICTTLVEKDNVVFTVEDNGHGISSANLDSIFEPFFTTKDVKKGTGLGLYVTREIIQGLNGTIEISSKVDIGTKFTVKIPFIIE
jgi:signal transduction histidine kinase